MQREAAHGTLLASDLTGQLLVLASSTAIQFSRCRCLLLAISLAPEFGYGLGERILAIAADHLGGLAIHGGMEKLFAFTVNANYAARRAALKVIQSDVPFESDGDTFPIDIDVALNDVRRSVHGYYLDVVVGVRVL